MIVELSDFQCPFCAQAQKSLHALQQQNAGRVRVEFRQFPLQMHRDSLIAARAAVCVGELGRFWEFHDLLFASQSDLGLPKLLELSSSLGADEGQFKSCINSGKTAAVVDADIREGGRLGINSTPTFFVNGRYAAGTALMERAVREELVRTAPAGR